MYHNWYEIYVSARQAQRDLYRRADDARRAEEARKARKRERKEAKRRARAERMGGSRPGSIPVNSLRTAR